MQSIHASRVLLVVLNNPGHGMMPAENSDQGTLGKDVAGTSMGIPRGVKAPSGRGGVAPKSAVDGDVDVDKDDTAANLLAEQIRLNGEKSALRREALKLARKKHREAMNLANVSQKPQEKV